VFADEIGQLFHPDRFSRPTKVRVEAAAVPWIGVHGLRYTHATLALRAGINSKIVQERLGHSNVAITLQVYSHVLPGMSEEAAETIAEQVFG
jgi:integrase